MDDKTMLEWAARAAGYELRRMCDPVESGEPCSEFFHVEGHYWNPLMDEVDALRLAVKLRLHVLIGEKVVTALYDAGYSHTESVNGDHYAATRRAIVRAAAEIGKEMGVG